MQSQAMLRRTKNADGQPQHARCHKENFEPLAYIVKCSIAELSCTLLHALFMQ